MPVPLCIFMKKERKGKMISGEQQEKEIATIKQREILLNLSDADCERVAILCGRHNLTISKLIENFIGDLVGGTYSNGSDEEDCANNWFERCWCGMFSEETLLKHLLDNFYDVGAFLNTIEFLQQAKADIEDYRICPEKYDKEEMEYIEDDIKYWEEEYKDYTEEYLREYPEADMEQEIAKVRVWFEQKEILAKGRE